MEKKYAYSTNQERYYGDEDSIEDCLAEAIGCNEEAEQIWIGECQLFTPAISASQVLEQLGEDAYSECGEAAEEWPDATKEQVSELEDALNATLKAWQDKHSHHSRFYTVHNVKEFVKEDGKFKEVV